MLVLLSGCVGPDDEFEIDDIDTEITYVDTGVNVVDEIQDVIKDGTQTR